MTTGRNISGPKIGHGRDPGPFGNHGGFRNLKRGSDPEALFPFFIGQVVNRLSMGADQVYLRPGNSRLGRDLDGRLGKEFTEIKVEMTDLVHASLLSHFEKLLPKTGRVRIGLKLNQLELGAKPEAGNLD